MFKRLMLVLIIAQSSMMLFFYLTEKAHDALVINCSLQTRSGFAAAGMPTEIEYFIRVQVNVEGYGLMNIDRPSLSINRPPMGWQCDKSRKLVIFSEFHPSAARFVGDPRDLGALGGLLMLVCVWAIVGGWKIFVRK